MEKYNTLSEEIERGNHHEIVKQNQISILGMTLVLGAILGILIGNSFEDPNSSLPTFLYTASAVLFFAGGIKLWMGRYDYVFKPTKSKLRSRTLYFNVHERTKLQDCIEMNRLDELKQLKQEEDSCIKLEVMMAQDEKFVALQILEYVPYAYEAVIPVKYYYGVDAQNLCSYLKS